MSDVIDQTDTSQDANVGDESAPDLRLVEDKPPEDSTSNPDPAIIEAILFASEHPLKASRIAELMPDAGTREVKKLIKTLNEKYTQNEMSFRIEEIAGGYQMLTLPQYHPYLSKLFQAKKDTRLSQAAMETLAIVAYKQPILRADVEVIRGVSCGEMLNRLRELNLVKIVGRAEDVGRPILYGTTKNFLEVFGLGSLEDLPSIEEFKATQSQSES